MLWEGLQSALPGLLVVFPGSSLSLLCADTLLPARGGEGPSACQQAGTGLPPAGGIFQNVLEVL